MSKKAAKTDYERAEEVLHQYMHGKRPGLLTHPEVITLIEIGIGLGKQITKIKISKGPADLDGDHD